VNLLLSDPMITVGPSLNLTKERSVGCPIWLTKFHQKRK